jgi:hypothetical protein
MIPNANVPAVRPVNVYGDETPDATNAKSDCCGEPFDARYASYEVAFDTAPHDATCEPFDPPTVVGFVVAPNVTTGADSGGANAPISPVPPSDQRIA